MHHTRASYWDQKTDRGANIRMAESLPKAGERLRNLYKAVKTCLTMNTGSYIKNRYKRPTEMIVGIAQKPQSMISKIRSAVSADFHSTTYVKIAQCLILLIS